MNIEGSSEDVSESRLNNLLKIKKILLAAFSAFMYIVVSGMSVAYTAPATVDMREPGSRLQGITTDEITWIASLLSISSGIGNIIAGYLTHKFGRRTILLYISFPYVLGWFIVAYAPNVHWIYFARLIQGFCYGSCSVAVPAYIVEIAPTNIRGLLTSGFQLTFTVGILIMMSLGFVLRWSWMAVVGAAILTVATCIMYFMPESPAWLLNKSKNTEAIDAIRFLLGKDADVDKEIESILGSITEQPSIVWRDIFKPELYKPIIIAICLMFFCQASGVLAIMSYTVDIFMNIGSSIDPQSSAFIFALVQLISTIFCSMLIEKVGRKVLFVCSGGLVSVALAILGAYTLLPTFDVDLSSVQWIPFACLIGYIAFFALGFGSVPLVVVSELVPIQSRSLLIAVAVVSSSIFTFIVTKTYGFLVKNVGFYGLFWIYGAFTLTGTLFGCLFLPETKGRSIADINRSFANYKSMDINDSEVEK